MKKNPLLILESLGQSIWLDFLRRSALDNGDIQRLIEQDGASGMTSNPSIFQKAIAGSHDYDSDIRSLALEGKSVQEIFEALAIDDIQRAADLFRPAYDRLEGGDGFVSLEVSPKLAHDTAGTIAEARRLWNAVDRPNIFIKVPATREGLPAIQQLTAEGINVNITLLFGLPRYREVADAYLAGLETLAARGRPLDRVASVASFFLSRIDVLVDPMLEKLEQQGGPAAEQAAGLRGQAAIASAKVAYQIYQEIFGSQRFEKLSKQGAQPQRLLWASTGTKNPEYSDVKYVEALIGPETINTVPLETLHAFREHGKPASRLGVNTQAAYRVLERLAQAGIDLDAVTQQLEDEGVAKFDKAFEKLMAALKEKRGAALEEPVDRQALDLGQYQKAVQAQISSLETMQFNNRLWQKDPSLWTRDPEQQGEILNALGWLHVPEKMEANLGELEAFKKDILKAGFRHVLHMGMGGSSLTPLVFERTFTSQGDGLPLTVLDSTDPGTILKIEQMLPIEETLFIVASKSGTTAEPLALADYFYQKVKQIKGERAGENFCAITDLGAPLVKTAQERAYRKTFLNFADIGGRYSALSYFGLVPAALMGMDLDELLERALRMAHACDSCVPAGENPGLILGAALGKLARNHKRDKVTFLIPEPISSLGMWLEQLLAESTGKDGEGLLPIAGEPLGEPAVYGEDRVFIYFRMKDAVDDALERGAQALREAGQPVITIDLQDLWDLGQEFFRWEIATAAAGAILGINPFDQPNVQESKDNTNRILALVRKLGKLPEEEPSLIQDPLKFYFDEKAAASPDVLRQFLAHAHPGNYLALMAFIPENSANDKALKDIRSILQDHLHLATTLGYGPRFLHSTGQFHKGGPNTGLFLQLTAKDVEDAPIPGAPYTLGTFKQAQAMGDLEALQKHGRRVGRIYLGSDSVEGLVALKEELTAALEPEEARS
ncbi:MAG TPA: bifunctional transaldolase/phosoglucose isomerase [Anaerolineales bacterium]|nr:bifunctional transaldolase/phosoglucose isomerase [Anaerolineales bacterium]